MSGDDPYDWSEHYRDLAERHMRESDRYKAWLFDAWRSLRGQSKGLKRLSRKVKALQQRALAAEQRCKELEAAFSAHMTRIEDLQRQLDQTREWLNEALLAWECIADALKDNPHWLQALPRIAEIRKKLDTK